MDEPGIEPQREPAPPEKRRGRVRHGATLGTAPISVGINFGVPLAGVSLALLYSAITSGGTALWIAGSVSLVFCILAFASGRTFT